MLPHVCVMWCAQWCIDIYECFDWMGCWDEVVAGNNLWNVVKLVCMWTWWLIVLFDCNSRKRDFLLHRCRNLSLLVSLIFAGIYVKWFLKSLVFRRLVCWGLWWLSLNSRIDDFIGFLNIKLDYVSQRWLSPAH